MTRQRMYPECNDFSEWMYECTELDSIREGITMNNVDMMFQKYITKIDKIGSRDLQLFMMVEVKTRGAMPNNQQTEVLFHFHTSMYNMRRKEYTPFRKRTRSVWDFGVYVLSFSHTTPDNSTKIEWCKFDDKGEFQKDTIDKTRLIEILRFDVKPDTLQTLNLRRHHKTQVLESWEMQPLGFETPVRITKRS